MSALKTLGCGLLGWLLVSPTLAAPVFDQLELVSTQRVSRFDFEYTYRVHVVNAEAAVTSVAAVVASASAATIIVDASLSFPDIDADASAVSTDTFTLRQDRRVLFQLESLQFDFQFDQPPTDVTPPTINAVLSAPANAAGWHNDTVTVSFDCADANSGIASCSPDVVVDTDSLERLVTGEAVDASGNTATAEVTIRRDTIAPAVTITSPLGDPVAPQAYVEGRAEDGLSGVDNVSCAGVAAGTSGDLFGCMLPLAEGPASVAVLAVDVAGNTGVATVEFTLDSLAPVLAFLNPTDGTVVAVDNVTLNATVEEDELAELSLNGTPIVANADGTIEITVPVGEGANPFTLSARDTAGNSASRTVTVRRDTQDPVVAIRSPGAGLVTDAERVDVLGAVNDIVPGIVSAQDCQVTVNGVSATVTAGSFIATNVPLSPGSNTVEAIAVDAAGNIDVATVDVIRQPIVGQRIRVLAGNGQSGVVRNELTEPLQVRLEDDAGQPIPDRSVSFEVLRGDGQLLTDTLEMRRVDVTTDADGVAAARFRLGSSTGAGNDQVRAEVPGFLGDSTFAFTATPQPATTLQIVSGDGQRAANGQALLKPLVVVALDDFANPVAGANVLFEIGGRGRVDGAVSLVKATDADGRTRVSYALGHGAPDDLGSVIARIEDAPDTKASTAVFFAYPKAVGGGTTTLSGVVLDDAETPLEGATVHIEGTAMTAVANADGSFRFVDPPIGQLHVEIDGSTAARGGPWPTLSFEIVTTAGTDNFLDAPVLLPELDAAGARLAGGGTDVTLRMADIQGVELTIFANSLTCPNGSSQCVVSISQVTRDRLPMAPPEGLTPGFAWTVQPSGALFDPPARIRIPNVDGLAPGQVADIFSFDHALNEFVRVASATVDADGASIVTDAGMGLRVAGWSIPPPPRRPRNCGADPVTAGSTGGDEGGGGGDGDGGGGDDGGDDDFDFDGQNDVGIRLCIPGPCSGGRSGFRTQVGRAWGWLDPSGGGECPQGNAVVGVRG